MQEFFSYISKCGTTLELADIEQLVKDIDQDGDGETLSESELVMIIQKYYHLEKQSLVHAIRKR